jgi:hypothetical protein
MQFHPEILSIQQQLLLAKLSFLTQKGFYLAGGTALAIQLGHRTSLDFDFYIDKEFKWEELQAQFEVAGGGEVATALGTFHGEINQVSLSGFYYPYPLAEELVNYEGLKLASIEDIAAMKVIAVIQRARQRDFFDLYYVIKVLGLEKIIKLVYEKYPWYKENNQIIITALTYFEEAENDDDLSRVNILDKSVTWEKVKVFIKSETAGLIGET